ncbi:MAG: DEAD/DEAH box helicase [Alphaproteobacteria bacterium]|nr:DEAD/DEAH box helicase [Alphaproteobacteria bacterium]
MADFQLVRDRLRELPVFNVIDAVVRDVRAGLVTVVAASTGSGKTMMLPGALADVSDHQIVVLVPRRFLAIDAAFNVAELAGTKMGDKVGYALGQMDGESSQRSGETRVLYCTYGYALSSGLINKAQTIILDEVHEADEQISLARAVLRERKTAEPDLRILEMSATVDAEAQARYWQPIAKTSVHAVAAKALDCDVENESPMQAGGNDRTIEQIALDLLKQGRKGIAIFRYGVKIVENSVLELKKQLASAGLRDVDIVGIHGGTPSDERRAARRAPESGRRKIIVGTNVIESGVNLRWLDAGLSDGYRNVPYRRDDTGADALVQEDLPQSGLLQQIGRVNRDPAATGFPRGLFLLHAKKPFDLRRPQNSPAIQRENLIGVAFRAASLGYDPTKLTWDIAGAAHIAALQPRLDQAKRELMRLHLVHDDWSLTQEGIFIRHLPVSPEVGAMLYEAKRVDEQRLRSPGQPPRVMRDVVIIAAIMESHGLRQDTKLGHKGDQHRTSDLLDAMNAFRALRREPVAEKVLAATESVLANASEEELAVLQTERAELQALCLKQNVSLNGFVEVARLAGEIANRLGQLDTGIRVDTRAEDDKYDAERYGEVQRCILNAHANRLFVYENDGLRDLLRDFGRNRSDAGKPFNGYELARGSIVAPPKEGALLAGALREIPSKQAGEPPLLVLTDVTSIPPEVFIAWASARAADHQPIAEDGVIENGRFNAVYAGKARFEIPVPPQMRAIASHLASQPNSPPRGGKNGKLAKRVP